MCGIVGFVGSAAASAVPATERACKRLVHRGPDGGAVWQDPNGQCVLGHRRLAILDLTAAAAQPMHSADGSSVISYNGEVYNYRELRSRLHEKGLTVRSTGDTEVVLEWLTASGTSGLSDLEGMFALALWDRRTRRLLLARDPIGIKPCYYSLRSDGLAFASETHALTATGLAGASVNQDGLCSFLRFGSVASPWTIYREVMELPAGCYLTVDVAGTRSRVERYWKPRLSSVSNSPLPAGARPAALRSAVAGSVVAHLASDVPTGVFLSGGIDSSAIGAVAASEAGSSLSFLRVSLDRSPSAMKEELAARAVAAHLGYSLQEVDLSQEEVASLAATFVQRLDQPTIDGLNTFIISKAARTAGLVVALSGIGADELFGGYPSATALPRRRWLLRSLPASGRAFLSRLVDAVPEGRRRGRLRALLSTRPELLELFLSYYRVFTDQEIGRLLGVEERKLPEPLPPPAWDLVAEVVERLPAGQALSWLELYLHLGNCMLRDTDQASMAWSVEIRTPYLHAPLLRFMEGTVLPADRGLGGSKDLLRGAFARMLPPATLEMPKRGFFLPMSQWITGPLRELVRGRLSRVAAVLPREAVDAVTRDVAGTRARPVWQRVWALAVLARWL